MKTLISIAIGFVIAAAGAAVVFMIRAGAITNGETMRDERKSDAELVDDLRREIDIIDSIPDRDDRKRAVIIRAKRALAKAKRDRHRWYNRSGNRTDNGTDE